MSGSGDSRSGRPPLDEILARAAELAPGARSAYLDEACDGDGQLRAEAASLLEVLEESRGFLEGGASPGIERIGPYRIGRRLGAGGMGEVYVGERADGEFDRRVAIKLIHAGLRSREIVRRFDQEKRVLAQLDHPGIAKLLDAGATPDGRPYLIMELIEGEPIDIHADSAGLPIRDRVKLLVDVCEAVGSAHRKRIVHRDLKPANVLVDTSGRVRLLDFGIAKVLDRGPSSDETATGWQRLTPRYASPEQVLQRDVEPASDVYSLGVLLYELVTGMSPYEIDPGRTSGPIELAEAVARIPVVRPKVRARQAAPETARLRGETGAEALARRVEGALEQVLLKALAKDPVDRYAQAEDFSADLLRYLEDLPVSARPESFRARAKRFLGTRSLSMYLQASRAARESENQRELAEQVGSLLQDVLASIDPARAQGRDIELLRSVLDTTAKRIRRDLTSGSPTVAALHRTIARTYHAIGVYEPAVEHFESAHRILEGGRAPALDLAEVEFQLGSVHLDRSEDEAAETVLRRALTRAESVVAPEEELLGRIHHSLGLLLERRGGDEDARRHLETALEIATRTLGREHLQTIRCIEALAGFLTRHDETGQARELCEEGVRLARASGDRLTLAWALSTHGFYFRWIHRYEEAESLFREALELREKVYDPNHPFISSALGELAGVLEFQGKFEDAEPLYRRGLEIDRDRIGPRSVHFAGKLNNLGGLLRKMGRLEEAQGYLEEALAVYRQALGDRHLWVIIARTNCAVLLLARGEPGKAEAEILSALDCALDHWPEDHWRFAILRNLRGACLAAKGDREEGEALLAQTLEVIERELGPDDPRTQEARARLVAVRSN